MGYGWNLKNRGARKSEVLGGWWVLEQKSGASLFFTRTQMLL
jgi:hypothetical protein